MTDPCRALCAELIEAVLADDSHIDCLQIARRAHALLERAMTGDATAAKWFLYEAGFTDKQGQWLPPYKVSPQ